MAALFARCKCAGTTGADGGVPAGDGDTKAAATTMPADVRELWEHARDGEDDELARLAAREGERGLEAHGTAEWHLTALRAMAFTVSFSALPALGEAAQHGSEPEATAAVDSADTIASRRRAQTDLEDRDELVAGCQALLGAAKDSTRPRPVRVGAVRALRMLADGYESACVKPVDIPSDVDAR